MQLPIQLKENVVSRAVYVDYNTRLVNANRKKTLWWVAAGILVFALILNTYEYLQHNKPFPLELCAIGLIGALTYFFIPRKLRAHFVKVYDTTPAISAKTDFSFAQDHVEVRSDVSQGEVKWSAFTGAVAQ